MRTIDGAGIHSRGREGKNVTNHSMVTNVIHFSVYISPEQLGTRVLSYWPVISCPALFPT